jgi:hypothetical protein
MPRSPDPVRIQLWADRLERFQDSGLTVSQFCSQESINSSGFYQWKKKLASPAYQTPSSLPPPPRFIPVQAKQPPQPNVAILRLPAGVSIELPSSFQRDAITELIAACIQAASVPSHSEMRS